MAPRALEICSIVQRARLKGLTGAQLLRLKALDASPKLIALLEKHNYPTRDGSSQETGANSQYTEQHRALAFLRNGNCWGFHDVICHKIQSDQRTNSAKVPMETNDDWKTEALTMLGLRDEADPDTAAGLRVADARFIGQLFRSAAVAYGLTHLLWPHSNPWTLYNWMRSLERAHPDIYTRIYQLIPKP